MYVKYSPENLGHPDSITVSWPGGQDHSGKAVQLEGSKSISNRALLIRALSGKPSPAEGEFDIEGLSISNDTRTLDRLLRESETLETFDAGPAGTTYRFLTAYLSTKTTKDVILTGSERMLQRPIGNLVNPLRKLGAFIDYIGREGYPPLRISDGVIGGGKVHLPNKISSQYISALAMIGPMLGETLEIELEPPVLSRPYIEMTLAIMRHFGAEAKFKGNRIIVPPGQYEYEQFEVEGDWSAASYHYGIVALSPVGTSLSISPLHEKSLQGDSALVEIYRQLGVESSFEGSTLTLTRVEESCEHLDYDFASCPDLAQTVAVTCAARDISARMIGLESLAIKETDRTAALQEELEPFGVTFEETSKDVWEMKGEFKAADYEIATYDDHRMAMAFAPLAMVTGKLRIEDPMVVGKSYPSFWDTLSSLGFGLDFS